MVLLISAVLGVLVTLTAYQSKMLVMQGSLLRGSINAENTINDVQAELVYKLTTSPLWLLGPSQSRIQAMNLPEDLNFHGTPFEYNGVTVKIQDTSGLISMVPFDEKTFKNFLRRHGFSDDEINIASDSIQDWMDVDDFKRLNGAEHMDYGVVGFPRNQIIPSLKELLEVQGVSDEMYAVISSSASLFGVGGVVERFAPTGVLQAVKSEQSASSIDSLRAKSSSLLDESTYPSRRLKISLSMSSEQGGYSKSFILVRGMGTRKPFFFSEYKFGE